MLEKDSMAGIVPASDGVDIFHTRRTKGSSLAGKHYFTTRDLVTVALLGCLGAALSTYVGYMARAFGSAIGLPIGGQMFTGLHVFWVILALALVNKKGAGLMAAILDNTVQFLMGSHLGIFVLPVGLLEGFFAELGYWPLKRLNRVAAFMLAGGLSAGSNLLIVQAAVRPFPNQVLLLLAVACSFISGIVFAGLLVYAVVKILRKAGLITRADTAGYASEFQTLPGAES